MSAMYRMIPDVSKGGGMIKSVNGKSTAVGANTISDLAFEEACTLQGWINCGLVGTSAQRPQNASLNSHYVDTTLAKVIFSDGRGGWHDPFTGGLV